MHPRKIPLYTLTLHEMSRHLRLSRKPRSGAYTLSLFDAPQTVWAYIARSRQSYGRTWILHIFKRITVISWEKSRDALKIFSLPATSAISHVSGTVMLTAPSMLDSPNTKHENSTSLYWGGWNSNNTCQSIQALTGDSVVNDNNKKTVVNENEIFSLTTSALWLKYCKQRQLILIKWG